MPPTPHPPSGYLRQSMAQTPSQHPSSEPSLSASPSRLPSLKPSSSPSRLPSLKPSFSPSLLPSLKPSSSPSLFPSLKPSSSPSLLPSLKPSSKPSLLPSATPSSEPSSKPSSQPSSQPSSEPSSQPSSEPSSQPSSQPSSEPSSQPSSEPSESPSSMPSSSPSESPSAEPSETPSANPSRSCENPDPNGCGFGIWNPWTCQCDCTTGICSDNNEWCNIPCAGVKNDINPFAGCAPGWDCPWYPDSTKGYCISTMNIIETFTIYRTAQECCTANYPTSTTCVSDGKAQHAPFPWPPQGYGKQNFYYPDLFNKINCVYGNKYEDWMENFGYDEYYLFDTASGCCGMWYPTRGDCPDTSSIVPYTTEDQAYYSNPYPLDNYYYPDYTLNNCGYGRDYPAWMGNDGYAQSYLFVQDSECCQKFFPSRGDCPAENTPQTGYYWESYQPNVPNHIPLGTIPPPTVFYPDLFSNTCINGLDYPDWMNSDIVYQRMYLYDTAEGCCTFWYGVDHLADCLNDVITRTVTVSTTATPTPAPEQWYPKLSEQICSMDGNPPSWMLQDGFQDLYIFGSSTECCAQWGYDCSSLPAPSPATAATTTVAPPTVGDWYPDLYNLECLNDGNIPSFMLQDGFAEWYTFSSESECCSVFDCSGT